MPETNRHSAIETFLRQVDERLRRLPDARRAAERDELAQHLDLLVTAYRARGMDEDAAARVAVERFGRAERIGADLRRAWLDEQADTFDYARWFAAYTGFIAVPSLAICWFSGGSMGFEVGFVVANGLGLPAWSYASERKRRRAGAEKATHA